MTRLSTGVLLLAAIGCASSGPPPELVAARAAYARASAGPAARLNPELLRQAWRDLARAEAAGKREEARDRGYLALRRAETAEATAQARMAVERRRQLDREIAALERARAEAPMKEAVAMSAGAVPAGASPERTVTVERMSAPGPAAAPSVSAAPEAPPPASSGANALERLGRLGSVRDVARGVEVTLPIAAMFADGSTRLQPEALATLENVAAAVKAVPGRDPIVLEVHGGGGPSREAELLLSQQRAETVRSFLIARGADPERVVARGVGTDRPLAGASPGAGARPAATAGGAASPPDDRLQLLLPR